MLNFSSIISNNNNLVRKEPINLYVGIDKKWLYASFDDTS